MRVALVDDDHMVEARAAQRADQAFGDRVRLRCPDGREDSLDADPGSARDEGGAVTAVAIPDQAVRLLTLWRRRDELAPDPFGGWMGGDIELTSRRRAWTTTKKTYNEWKVNVGTMKKSAVQMCGAWFRRNIRQVCDGGWRRVRLR